MKDVKILGNVILLENEIKTKHFLHKNKFNFNEQTFFGSYDKMIKMLGPRWRMNCWLGKFNIIELNCIGLENLDLGPSISIVFAPELLRYWSRPPRLNPLVNPSYSS